MSVLVSVCVCSTSLAQNRNSVLRSLESVFWLESTSPFFGDKTIREEKMTSVNGSNKNCIGWNVSLVVCCVMNLC